MRTKVAACCGIFVLVAAILPAICGVLFATSGHVLVAKLLFEQVDQCRLNSDDMTLRLYVGSFGATTAYTQLATAQEGPFLNEWIIFSSYGGIPIDRLSCGDTTVTLVGEQNLMFSAHDIRTRLVESPVVLEWGDPVPSEEILNWDPFRLLLGGPLLIMSGVLILVGGGSVVWAAKKHTTSSA